MPGGHGRGTIKSDLNKESQTGTPPDVRAIESYNVGVYNLVIEAPILTMQTRTVYLIPPSGVVCQVKALDMVAQLVAGFAVGTHELEAYAAGDISVLKGVSAYNNGILYTYEHWGLAVATGEPVQEISQVLALQSLIGGGDAVITFVYRNYTNTTQNSNITIDVACREGVN